MMMIMMMMMMMIMMMMMMVCLRAMASILRKIVAISFASDA